MTRARFAVLGDPIAHSRSPQMHAAAFRAMGLDHEYGRRLVQREHLASALAHARSEGLRGVNLTVPHKIDALGMMDVVDASAERIGAVNTVDFDEDGVRGRNTDAAGFVHGLEHSGVDAPRTAIVLGAGGAARAIVFGLLEHTAVNLHWVSRRPIEIENPRVRVTGYNALSASCDADLLVNATTVGMGGRPTKFPIDLPLESLSKSAVVCDIVIPTPRAGLLHAARERGLRTLDWRPMLVGQGVLALEGWLGHELPSNAVAAMRDALDATYM